MEFAGMFMNSTAGYTRSGGGEVGENEVFDSRAWFSCVSFGLYFNRLILNGFLRK
jgi:hypothetical protein